MPHLKKLAALALLVPFAISPALAQQDNAAAPQESASGGDSQTTPGRDAASPATLDTNNDGKADAWDRDSNGTPDAWDKDGDGKPDKFDDDGDGKPDNASR